VIDSDPIAVVLVIALEESSSRSVRCGNGFDDRCCNRFLLGQSLGVHVIPAVDGERDGQPPVADVIGITGSGGVAHDVVRFERNDGRRRNGRRR